MAGEYRGGARVTLAPENGAASKSFELPSGEDRRIRMGRAKENDMLIEQKGTSWFHAELRLLAPELRGSSGALVKLRDTSTNGIGLKAPGASTIRLSKGADHPVPDGSHIIIPFKVKAEDGKSQEELRTTVKVMVSKLGDPGLSAPPGNWSTSAAEGLEPPPLPQAPSLAAEPRPKAPAAHAAASLAPKAALPKSSGAARPKAAAPKTLPKPLRTEEQAPKAALAKSMSRPPAREAVEEDFPPAIPAGSMPPPAHEASIEKPKERRRRDRSRSRRDKDTRGARRRRGDPSSEGKSGGRSGGRSRDRGRRREDHRAERPARPEPGPPPSTPPPPPAPPPAPLAPPIEVQDGTAKRFEEMMKRVKAFALEKEKTYEERVAECRAQEEADKKKREEEEEEEEAKRREETKRKEEEELRRKEEKRKEDEESRPSSPSKPKSSQGAQSNMAQMQMMAMMMGNMGQMMGMGGMGMPGMGMGMPPAQQAQAQAVPKGGAHLQGFVAVKSGHPPPPGPPGPPPPPGDTGRDSIGAVTKSKSAGAPPPLPAPGAPWAQGPPDMNFAAKAPSPPPPPPPSGGGFDQQARPEGEDRKEPRRRGFSDAPGDRGPNGGERHRSRDSRREQRSRGRSRDRDRPVYDGGRSRGGGGGLADWQEKDIEDFCDKYNLDERLKRDVTDALAKRLESFTQDLSSLTKTLETARNPPGLLKVKLREMEDGSFVAKGDKGKGKGGGKGKDGGKDSGKDRGKGPMMSSARKAELFGDDSPRPSRSRRSRKRSRSRRSRRRRSPAGDESGDEAKKDEPRKRLPRGSNFS